MKFRSALLTIVMFQISIALASSNTDAEAGLIQRTQKALDENKTNQETIDQLAEVITPLERKLARFHRLRAETYFQNKQYDLAIKDYTSALKYSHSGYIEFSIGRCYYEQTRYYDAILMFDKVIDSIPDDKSDYKFLCSYYKLISLINMQKFEQATPLYRSLKEKKPNDSELKKLAEYFEDTKNKSEPAI